MKIIKPKVTIIEQSNGLFGIHKQIELAGRTCYKSEDKITMSSAKGFVENLIERKHYAMLEHGTVYLHMVMDPTIQDVYITKDWFYNGIPATNKEIFDYYRKLFTENKYSKCNIIYDKQSDMVHNFITTNYRVIVENRLECLLDEYLCNPTNLHHKRITMKFITSIGVTREGNRHRVNSVAEESTRFCDYTKTKFNNELNISEPSFLTDEEKDILKRRNPENHLDIIALAVKDSNVITEPIDWFCAAITFSEMAYRNLVRLGWSPQKAREVLPLATKSEVVYTAFVEDWAHWFNLRYFGYTGTPHPNMKQIASLAKKELEKHDLWKYIEKYINYAN